MQRKLAILSIAAASLLAASPLVRAETADDMSFSGMFKSDRIDGNKDGMVSKAEFLAQMGKVWDMKMKEMHIKGDKMRIGDYEKQILMYFRAGS